MPTSTRPKSGTPATWQMVNKAYDVAALAQSCLSQLDALFVAIKELSDRPLTEQDLADMGSYLAEDWGGLIEAQCEDLKQAMEDRP
jgi:hypothetical protein